MESPISAGDNFEFDSSPIFSYAGPSGLYLVCHAPFLLDTSDPYRPGGRESMVKPVQSVILFWQIFRFYLKSLWSPKNTVSSVFYCIIISAGLCPVGGIALPWNKKHGQSKSDMEILSR